MVKVNDRTTADFTDPNPHFPKGYIALQSFHPDTVVHFRKIEIKELPPSKSETPPLAVAPFDAAKAKEHQEAWAKHLGVPVEFENSIGMKLRLIPPGEFMMGTAAKEIEAIIQDREFKGRPWAQDLIRDEGPERRVAVAEPFYLGAHEVTVAQFRQFVVAKKFRTVAETTGGGYAFDPKSELWGQSPKHIWSDPEFVGSESHPVSFVTLADAKAFCTWLGVRDGLWYVVPTEQQWEFACRAGTTARWSFGDDSASMKLHGWAEPHADGKHRQVGRLATNPFGLSDLYGNARELTLDAKGEPVSRGGDARSSALEARSATRFPLAKPGQAYFLDGFRVAVVGNLKRKALPPKEPDLAVLQPLRDAVAARGRTVAEVKLRFEAGKASKLDLLAAQVELREANIKLAEAEDDKPILILHLRELVKLREEERELIALKVKVGVERPDALNQAEARLADAKARLAKVLPPEIAPPPRPKP